MCKTILKMCKREFCKSANVRKTVVHKMRKSAAQIIFRMQVLHFSQICTVHNFVCASFRRLHNLFSAQCFMLTIFYNYAFFFCVKNFINLYLYFKKYTYIKIFYKKLIIFIIKNYSSLQIKSLST